MGHPCLRTALGRAAAIVLVAAAALLAPRAAHAQAQQLYELSSALANASAAIAISTATTTELVAAPSGKGPGGATQQVYVTGYEVVAAGTGNIKFVTGTKTTTPCDTGATDLTGAYTLVAQARIHGGNGFGPVWVLPAGQELCAVTTAAVGMNGYVSYRVK